MGKDNRRIAPPSNCISPSTFSKIRKTDKLINKEGLRNDGRNCDDCRPITLKVGLVPSVTGSAYLEYGNTKVIASVNGPRDVMHQSGGSLSKGQLFCEFKYAIFSCKERQSYLPTDEELGISKSIQDALEPVILLHKFPKARLDISILVLENDGGAISAALTCAGAALSNAGVEMFDLPIGCSLLYTEEKFLVDPTAKEEHYPKTLDFAKISMAMMPAYNNQIIFMDSLGCLKPDLLSKVLKTLQSKCQLILTHIKDCLKTQLKSSSEHSAEEDEQESVLAAELKLFQPQKYISAFLESNIRPDGRELDEFRPVLITVGSIGTAHGSALIRLNKTSVICGIKAELVNPLPEEPDKGFFIPNVTLTPICSNRYQPGPPSEQAQVYSQMIMDLFKNSDFLDPSVLCIEKNKLSWCLFVDMICLSYDGNILDACIIALMAALKNLRLPEVTISVDTESVEVTDKLVPVPLNYFLCPATFAILKDKAVADPSSEEESLADGTLTVFLKDSGLTSVQSFGCMTPDQIFSCLECSKVRYKEMKKLIKVIN